MQREADRINKAQTWAFSFERATPFVHPKPNERFSTGQAFRLRKATAEFLFLSLSFSPFFIIWHAIKNEQLDRKKATSTRSSARRNELKITRLKTICLNRPAGTAKLNAHVLTERLPGEASCQTSFGACEIKRANRCFSGKPCGSCRVICSLSHAQLRGYAFLTLLNLFLAIILHILEPLLCRWPTVPSRRRCAP